MSRPKDDKMEFIENSDTDENHLTSSDEKSLTEKGKEISRNVEEDSKSTGKCIVQEIATEKENESHGETSVDEFEVTSKPECQAEEQIGDGELEITNLQKNVVDGVQKQNAVEGIEEKENVEHIEEIENTDSIADEHQNDDRLNASAFDGISSENLECDGESLSDDEIRSYDTTTSELTVGKISETVLQVFEERSLHKEKGTVSECTQVSGGSVDEQNQDFEADYQAPAVQNAPTSTESFLEVTIGNVDRNVLVDEENEDFSKGSKMPEVQNAATSTEDSAAVTDESECKELNFFPEERKRYSAAESKTKQVQNAATSMEVSIDEVSSPNEKKLSAKHSRRSSEEVTEIISKYLNSEGYIKKLDKIDEFVKQLTSAEFATEDLSPEDFEILKERYSQQLEKMATKRKSKLSELEEDSEDLQAISKKCKLSSVSDRPFKLQGWESSCCLEEQFRIAFKETSDDHSGNTEKVKEYRFPLSTGNEQQRKFCKHQIAKIDAMVASAMPFDNYMSPIPDELDDPSNSIEEVHEDTPCCYHIKAQSSSSERKFKNKMMSGPRKSVPKKMIADSNEELSETSDKAKWYSYFSFEKGLNCVKNFILFVSFTFSLMVAMTVGKVFGVDFPVGKSKRNSSRDNSVQESPSL